MTPDFVGILNAAWTLASATTGWTTTERVLRHWSDVQPVERPYLAQAMVTPLAEPLGRGADTKWTLPLKYYVYVSHVSDGLSPQELLAERLGVLVTAFDAPPGLPAQTLGGRVHACRIEGSVEMDDGWLGTDGVLILPVTLVVG